MSAPTCPACGGTIQATVDVDMTLTADGWEIAPTGGDYRLYCENDCDDADFDEIETPDVYRLTYVPETEEVPDCLHCGFPVFDRSGAVVRCEVCGPFCCEDHHVRHPSYAHHDIAPDAVPTGEWCDACAHPESLHDERIRTVGDGVAPCSTCAVCVAVHTGHPGDDEPGIEEHDHANEDARNARYRQ